MNYSTPVRQQGKSLFGIKVVGLAIAANKTMAIGCSDVDAMYDRIMAEYPDAKVTKHKGYVRVEKK